MGYTQMSELQQMESHSAEVVLNVHIAIDDDDDDDDDDDYDYDLFIILWSLHFLLDNYELFIKLTDVYYYFSLSQTAMLAQFIFVFLLTLTGTQGSLQGGNGFQ